MLSLTGHGLGFGGGKAKLGLNGFLLTVYEKEPLLD